VGIVIGAVAAVIGISVSPRIAGTTQIVPVKPLKALTVANNKQPLTASELSVLRNWAERFHTCAAEHGLATTAPVVARDEILLRGVGNGPITVSSLKRSFTCTGRGPPPQSAFQLRHGVLHLYRPRACLLPVHPSATT
jgi:hypothetical protein